MVTRPWSGRYNPAISLSMVDLPAPFGPIRPSIVPSRTETESPPNARRPPKRFDTLSHTTAASRLTSPGAGRAHHLFPRAPDHRDHFLAPVPKGVHFSHETDQRPAGHLPSYLRQPHGVAGDKRSLPPQRFRNAHQLHLPVRALHGIGVDLHHHGQLPLGWNPVSRPQVAPGDLPFELIDDLEV